MNTDFRLSASCPAPIPPDGCVVREIKFDVISDDSRIFVRIEAEARNAAGNPYTAVWDEDGQFWSDWKRG